MDPMFDTIFAMTVAFVIAVLGIAIQNIAVYREYISDVRKRNREEKANQERLKRFKF